MQYENVELVSQADESEMVKALRKTILPVPILNEDEPWSLSFTIRLRGPLPDSIAIVIANAKMITKEIDKNGLQLAGTKCNVQPLTVLESVVVHVLPR